MSTLASFTSVPGLFVPGLAEPGRDGLTAQGGTYLYTGLMACFYLDYTDAATGHTLAPVPGNYYTMTVANPRFGLTVPPPGRPWFPGNPGAGGTFAPLFTGPRRTLAESRAALEQQRNVTAWHDRQPAPQPRHDGPVPPPPPPPAPTVMQQARAALEESRLAHGHYQPGGCKKCMSGG